MQIQGNSNCTKTEPFYCDLSRSGELALVLTPEPQRMNGFFDGGTFSQKVILQPASARALVVHSSPASHLPTEGVKLPIYTNTTTAAKPSLCFCNKTLSSTSIILVQHNPRRPSTRLCGCYTSIPRRSGAASQVAASLLFYAFLRTEGREDRGSVTINPKRLSQIHRFIQVLTFTPISHGTWMTK